jgi:hypothetical protein
MSQFKKSREVVSQSVLHSDEGRLDVKIKFNDGRVYVLAFCDAAYVESESSNGCFVLPALIILDKVSMEKVKQVIGYIAKTGYFESLVPLEE